MSLINKNRRFEREAKRASKPVVEPEPELYHSEVMLPPAMLTKTKKREKTAKKTVKKPKTKKKTKK